MLAIINIMKDKQIAGFMLEDWYVFDNFAPFQIEWQSNLYPNYIDELRIKSSEWHKIYRFYTD